MQVLVNGKACEVKSEFENSSLAVLMLELGYAGRSVAVVIDGKVLPRSKWGDKPVTDGLCFEVVAPMQGG